MCLRIKMYLLGSRDGFFFIFPKKEKKSGKRMRHVDKRSERNKQ